MSTEHHRNSTDLAEDPAAGEIAASMARQATSRVTVELRYARADDADSSAIQKSTATEAHPYTSFEQGGVRRFERTPFARGPFGAGSDLTPFRLS